METFPKKKIEIVVEKPLLEEVIGVIDRFGARGYSVVPLIAGRGTREGWTADKLSGAFDRVLIVVIVEPALAAKIVDEAFALLKPYNAIVYLSDVAVLRQDHF